MEIVLDERTELARAGSGDERLAGQIYDRHAPELMRFLVLLLHEQEAAEDVLQETFSQVFRNAAKFDPKRSGLATWLRRVAFKLACNELRRRRRKPALSLETVVRSENGEMRPLRQLLAASDSKGTPQAVDRALDALDRLPEEHRQVLLLRFVEGMPPRDIAAVMNITPKAVSMRIWRAVKVLQGELGTKGADLW